MGSGSWPLGLLLCFSPFLSTVEVSSKSPEGEGYSASDCTDKGPLVLVYFPNISESGEGIEASQQSFSVGISNSATGGFYETS